MIIDLDKKLNGELPINKDELIELVNSHGRTTNFSISENYISSCEPKEKYPLENLDVSQIENLSYVFTASPYNGDLSKWNVSNCTNMYCMFWFSKFNNDSLKNWDVSNVINMASLFETSEFNSNSISNWNISNVSYMIGIFCESKFDGDISSWNFNKEVNCDNIFDDNKNFENKYNSGKELPLDTYNFLKWFEENRENIKQLNIPKEEVLDFFSFESNKEIKL